MNPTRGITTACSARIYSGPSWLGRLFWKVKYRDQRSLRLWAFSTSAMNCLEKIGSASSAHAFEPGDGVHDQLATVPITFARGHVRVLRLAVALGMQPVAIAVLVVLDAL